MASTNPVPSRAALNALRGVVLTTSCSVILLAEERRRRLKIARTAIDNARKLHTVRSNRGPLALTEGLSQWEGSFSGVGDDVLAASSLPRPRTATRRRRRRDAPTDPIPTDADIHKHSRDVKTSRTSQTAEASTAGLASLHAFVPDMINLESLKFAAFNSSTRPRDLSWKPPRAYSKTATGAGGTISESSVQGLKLDSEASQSLGDLPASTDPSMPAKAVDPLDAARSYLIRSAQTGSNSPQRPFYDEALVILEQLLRSPNPTNVAQAEIHGQIDLATRVLQRLASFGLPLPRASKPIRNIGIELLRLTSRDEPSKMTHALAALIPLCRDPLKAIVPCLGFVQESGSVKHLEHLLGFLSDRKQAKLWMRGMLVHRLLARYAKLQASFESTKKLYQAMQSAGLFRLIEVPHTTEYRIRRLIAILAAEAQHDAFLSREIRAIQKMAPDALELDLQIQSRLVVRDAELGKWDLVHDHLQRLTGSFDVSCVEFQTMLIRITDVFAQGHSPAEVESFVRALATTFHLKPKYRWVYMVLDEHASHHQVGAVFRWLQFCSDSGLPMDDAFIERFYTRCRKYWSFSDTSIANLQKSLRASGPPAQVAATSTHDAVDARETGQALSTVEVKGKSASSAGLRRAVMQYLGAKDGTKVDLAIGIVREAHEQGLDVSDALTPLLMARLERGDDPNELIEEALRMGARIHDSAFNKATQVLSATGNLGGAAEMCKVAARENGNGKLLYNEYNFANLVFAYTGAARYKALHSLLCDFTSGEQWWHGSRTCKESVKLAMKTAAMRTVVQQKDKKPHRLALDQLDAALVHVKRCRSNRGHRRAVTEAFVRVIKSPPASVLHDKMAQKGAHIRGRAGRQLMEVSGEVSEPAARPVLAAAAGAG
ncbi:hypothetical protein O9K51_01881 [Purpureocillium lavendulum]|uniref:Pentatricopeptide repeat protein n=1 Tax=Purpureocillium lavendulum TaxID=1247861 RepID=A0AB34G876_9HYPO|nr:hypothetical protein O9K51_01881 [Purpureocillium lavendulum]